VTATTALIIGLAFLAVLGWLSAIIVYREWGKTLTAYEQCIKDWEAQTTAFAKFIKEDTPNARQPSRAE
jgi:hypothetical protein